jgi:two-component system, OmpR family, manganese sensing sensor histidine kinase
MSRHPQQVAKQTIASDLQYSGLRWRLLLSYLAVMLATFGIAGMAIYGLFVRSLYRQMDERLGVLADAAAHSLTDIQQRSLAVVGTSIDPAQMATLTDSLPTRPIDRDGDLDISWQKMRSPTQGIEWFDSHRQLLTSSGRVFGSVPLQPDLHPVQTGQLHSLTLTVYKNLNGQKNIQGYVRVNESVRVLEAELSQLQWVLGVGGIVVLGLTGMGSVWLTQQSLQPIRHNLQQLQQFTVDASHELRSPLTAVKISVDVLQSESAGMLPADRHRIEIISKGIEQIRYLVEDLLLLTRMDVHLTAHEWRVIAVDEVLEDLLALLESQAQDRQITLESRLLAAVNVNGDNTQLPRLFRNLLDNALKYTPAGGIVTVTMQRTNDAVTVRIIDTGMGIAGAHLPLVFDRFWRADINRAAESSGLGLGLAIAQSIARSHRGEITVDSQLQLGSCFQVKLPLA